MFTLSLYPDLAMTIRLVKGQFCSVKKTATLFGREESGSTLGVPESGLNGSGIESLRERDNAFCYESVMKEFSSPINTKRQLILIILFLVEQEGEATSFLDKIGQFLCV